MIDALNMSALEEYASSYGLEIMPIVRGLMRGETSIPERITELLRDGISFAFDDLKEIGASLLIPSLSLMTAKLLMPAGMGAQKTLAFVCRAGAIAALGGQFAVQRAAAGELIGEIERCSNLLSPVMIAAVTLSGAETTGVLLTPMTGMAANMIQKVLGGWGLAFSAAAAGIAVAGNLSAGINLNRLRSLFKKLFYWICGATMTGFVAVLSLQGRLGSVQDSAAVRTARYAVENIIPIIGGNVSDSLDSLLTAALNVKNAVGTAGLILIAYIFALPVMRIAVASLVLRFLSAVMEPLCDDGLSALTNHFADAVEMLFVSAMASMVLCALIIGSCLMAAGNVVR